MKILILTALDAHSVKKLGIIPARPRTITRKAFRYETQTTKREREMSDETREREAFEKAYEQNFGHKPPGALNRRDENGEWQPPTEAYGNNLANYAWWGWQSRALHQSAGEDVSGVLRQAIEALEPFAFKDAKNIRLIWTTPPSHMSEAEFGSCVGILSGPWMMHTDTPNNLNLSIKRVRDVLSLLQHYEQSPPPADTIATGQALLENEHAIRRKLEADIAALADDVAEYLSWRKANKHIKGGGNYLSRLAESIAPFTKKAGD